MWCAERAAPSVRALVLPPPPFVCPLDRFRRAFALNALLAVRASAAPFLDHLAVQLALLLRHRVHNRRELRGREREKEGVATDRLENLRAHTIGLGVDGRGEGRVALVALITARARRERAPRGGRARAHV